MQIVRLRSRFKPTKIWKAIFSKFKELETRLWPPPATNKTLGTTVAPESLKVPKCMLCQENLSLSLFVDADFAGSDDNAKSTNGGLLVLAGPKTFFPIQWISKRESCTSRSTTEFEVVSLAYSLLS